MKADLVAKGGRIYPLGRHGLRPVSHLAVSEGRVAAAGGPEVDRLRGPQTRVLDLEGGALMPGFDDAHAHVVYNGLTSFWVKLTGTRTLPALLDRVRRHARRLPPGEWCLGRGYSSFELAEGRAPTRDELDSVTGGRPCFVDERGGHSRVANSAALAAAGITADTADPPGGRIGRDGAGRPDGRLYETAMRLVADVQPPPSFERRKEGVLRSQRLLLSRGITSVGAAVNRGFAEDLRAYLELSEARRLRMRVNAFLSWELLEAAARLGLAGGFGGLVRAGPIKVFVDGGASGGAVALRGERNVWRTSPHELRRIVSLADAAGLQVAAHAIGDAAIEAMCDAVAAAGPSAASRRHRVEHCSVCGEDLRRRLALLGMAAVMQPLFLRLGRERSRALFGDARSADVAAHAALLRAGVKVAFSSDLPVTEEPNPWPALRLATEDALQPLTRLQALAAYTSGGAWVAHQEGVRGSLEPGMAADFQVYKGDPISASADTWDTKLRPSLVAVGGAIAFRRN